MVFSIKKKEKKIFGMELSETTRTVITAFAKNGAGLTQEEFEVVSCLHDFDSIPDNVLKGEVLRYIKVIRRRIIICAILSVVVEAGFLYSLFDLMVAYGESRGMKTVLNSDICDRIQKDARIRMLDSMYEDCKHADVSVATIVYDDGKEEYLVSTLQDTDPRKED